MRGARSCAKSRDLGLRLCRKDGEAAEREAATAVAVRIEPGSNLRVVLRLTGRGPTISGSPRLCLVSATATSIARSLRKPRAPPRYLSSEPAGLFWRMRHLGSFLDHKESVPKGRLFTLSPVATMGFLAFGWRCREGASPSMLPPRRVCRPCWFPSVFGLPRMGLKAGAARRRSWGRRDPIATSSLPRHLYDLGPATAHWKLNAPFPGAAACILAYRRRL